jgi:hypothetical protein
MAGNKILVLTVLGLFLASGSTALELDIDVAPLTDHRATDIEYRENFSNFQEINASIENVGSIGCQYRLRAQIDRKNTTFTRYSKKKALWPGDSARLELHDYPINYTGVTGAQLQVQYCGQTKNISQFNYTNTENVTTDKTLESRTRELNSERVSIKTGVEEGLMIPQEIPPYWKTGSATVENSTAEIEYEPTIFKEGEEFRYLVLNQSTHEPEGVTTVKLETPQTLWDKLIEKKLQIILTLLFISLTGNMVLIHDKKTEE